MADQRNMAFKGTAVTNGRGAGIVVATGMATALGRVADLLQTHPAGLTPLQRRLSTLGKGLAAVALVVCAIVFVAGVARGESVELMFLTSVSLAVAAIPEALPAMVTVSLAFGAQRMANRRALTRKLPAVETLGSVNVVCSDKTGTLTQNRMLVERVWTPRAEYQVAGPGYEPAGPFTGDSTRPTIPSCRALPSPPSPATTRPWSPRSAVATRGRSRRSTEGALLALAGKLGVNRRDLDARLPRLAEFAFDAERRRMTTVHQDQGRVWVAMKGGLDALGPLGHPGEHDAWDARPQWPTVRSPGVPGPGRRRANGRHGPGLGGGGRERSLLLGGAMADPPREASAGAVAARARASHRSWSR